MLRLLFSIVRNVISVSKVTSLSDWSLRVFSKCLCHCICLCHCLCLFHCTSVGQVVSPHHSDQMSKRSQVSSVALSGSSLNVFVIVIVIVIVIVFVIVIVLVILFLLVRSCFLISLIKCLKSLRVLYDSVFQQCVVVSEWVSDKVTYR